ncbi:hypothetical protein [Nocardioides sp. YIM 152588]|uniref:hypothetical protein n=1 Tax=Nocardioides sp. YIM 152588 TaxID=3158259 RepID=UPI0032E4FB0C
MNNDAFFLIEGPELEYRRSRNRKAIAGRRGQRSRSSWLRRLADNDPGLSHKSD